MNPLAATWTFANVFHRFAVSFLVAFSYRLIVGKELQSNHRLKFVARDKPFPLSTTNWKRLNSVGVIGLNRVQFYFYFLAPSPRLSDGGR